MDPVQDKIERAKRELEQMIDLNPQVMLLVDGEGRITRANRALLHLLGLSGYPAVLGKRLEDVFPGNDGLTGLLLNRDGIREHETEIESEDGTRHTVHFTVVGVRSEGELTAVIVRDVGVEKAEAASLAIRHKTEAVKAVAGALMHNVNQSLTVIMVNAQLLSLMLEKGFMNLDDLAGSLRDIVRETTCIADVLKDIGRPSTFVTEPYPGSDDILDIRRSAGSRTGGGQENEPRGYVWLESSFTATVEILLKLLDAHECGSSGHSTMVAEYAVVLSRKMGFAAEYIAKVRSCALLHDIGKLGIPDAILCKPSPLSEQEKVVMNGHSDIGFRLLNEFPFAGDEAAVARSHHERWDGGGYPQGLAGKAIHPMARIVSVSDAIDALRRRRPYSAAASSDAIAAEITSGSGTQFDPEVVSAFNACRPELESVAPLGTLGV